MRIVIIIIAVVAMLGWNIGSSYLVTCQNFDITKIIQNNQPVDTEITTNVDRIIEPPLNTTLGLPQFTTFF